MTAIRPADDYLLNWLHKPIALLLTATVCLGSLSLMATALGDPELVVSLALVGCVFALLGLEISALCGRRLASITDGTA